MTPFFPFLVLGGLAVVWLGLAALVVAAVHVGARAEAAAEAVRADDDTVHGLALLEAFVNSPHHPAWGPARHVEGRAS